MDSEKPCDYWISGDNRLIFQKHGRLACDSCWHREAPDWEDNEDCPGDDKEVAEFRCNVLMDGYQKEFILLILYARKQTVP